ncbi:ribonuclease E/G [Anaerosacchariphilus polymeriproducens]|uniref:Ribonuclease E/G n=2 Tax=Anaerosacchariphilus polymeriproducens TaxID=1812858 RepID=A0A371AUC9_9FIRM|nr:ribonuclease E/G [Anaerosacchariphilus polymeriproducens]
MEKSTQEQPNKFGNISRKFVVSALFEKSVLKEINFDPIEETDILSNIYIGRVENIVKNIQAAFIEIEKGLKCYYSLEDNENPIFTKKNGKNNLNIGDELLVQVSKEAIKTKAAVVSSNLNFKGKYFILTTEIQKIGYSNKLDKKQKSKLQNLLQDFKMDSFGMIVRTNAQSASKEQLEMEWNHLKTLCSELLEKAPYRTCFSLLYQANPKYLEPLNSSYCNDIDEIITDDENIYRELKEYSNKEQSLIEKLKFYDDKLLPLVKLYSIEKHMDSILKERVWLKSGAYIIIQPTEAFVSIDVNTGKFVGKKRLQETFLKINLEAAEEIAKQIRLRNLSGICVIDFIDLEREEDKKVLMNSFKKYLELDPIPIHLVGMSKLNLVELTRKKIRKSIYEQVSIKCPLCHGNGYLY